MRIFSGLVEAYNEIQRDLFEVGAWIHGSTYQDKNVEGDPDYDFMELSPYVYSLTGTEDLNYFIEERGLDLKWIKAEFNERIGHDYIEPANPGSAWKLRREVWEEFLGDDGKFAYTYAERFHPGADRQTLGQPLTIIAELNRHPASRQAIVQIFDVHKDLPRIGGETRIPCSMFYQLMIRNEAVDLHYVMRSCDFAVHFPYDQLLAIRFQEFAAYLLNCPVGVFHHIITSLHMFRKSFPEGVF